MASSSKAGEIGYVPSEDKQEEEAVPTENGNEVPRQPPPAALPADVPPRTSSLRRYSALTVARSPSLRAGSSPAIELSNPTATPPSILHRIFKRRRRQEPPDPPPRDESPTSAVGSGDAHLLPIASLERPPRLPLSQLLRQHSRTMLRLVGHIFLAVGLLVAWSVLATHYTAPSRKSSNATAQGGNSTSTLMPATMSGPGEVDMSSSDFQPNRTVEAGNDDSNATGKGLNANVLVIGALFLLASLINAGFLYNALRFVLNLWRLPAPPTRSPGMMTLDQRIQEMRSRGLPSYVAGVGGEGGGTGDVEDRWIVGEGLPLYGETRHSTLLLRSASRQTQNRWTSDHEEDGSESSSARSQRHASEVGSPGLQVPSVAASRAPTPQLSESIRTSFQLLSRLEDNDGHAVV